MNSAQIFFFHIFFTMCTRFDSKRKLEICSVLFCSGKCIHAHVYRMRVFVSIWAHEILFVNCKTSNKNIHWSITINRCASVSVSIHFFRFRFLRLQRTRISIHKSMHIVCEWIEQFSAKTKRNCKQTNKQKEEKTKKKNKRRIDRKPIGLNENEWCSR